MFHCFQYGIRVYTVANVVKFMLLAGFKERPCRYFEILQSHLLHFGKANNWRRHCDVIKQNESELAIIDFYFLDTANDSSQFPLYSIVLSITKITISGTVCSIFMGFSAWFSSKIEAYTENENWVQTHFAWSLCPQWRVFYLRTPSIICHVVLIAWNVGWGRTCF